MKKIIAVLLMGAAFLAGAGPTNNPTAGRLSLTVNLSGELVAPTNFFDVNAEPLNAAVSYDTPGATNLPQRVIKPDGVTITGTTNGAGVVTLSSVASSGGGQTTWTNTQNGGGQNFTNVGPTDFSDAVRFKDTDGHYTTWGINGPTGVASLPDTTLSSLSVSNSATVTGQLNATNINGVKVYRALLDQVFSQQSSGSLIVGHTYIISAVESTDDFYNVGFSLLDNNFIATGTTPTQWSNGTIVTDITASAPVATILENTLGGVPTFTYETTGSYVLHLTGAFTTSKTMASIGYAVDGYPNSTYAQARRSSANEIEITTGLIGGSGIDDELSGTWIEILVYP